MPTIESQRQEEDCTPSETESSFAQIAIEWNTRKMRYLSLFSGIEAATVAWAPLGWECAAVAEIESFPNAVLAHHYPTVPNLGDVTKITRQQIESLGCIDVVIFGFPCQDLSVAGLRKGLNNADGTLTRSGLFYTASTIAEWSRARWTIAENVPGLFSQNKGGDFASVVGELAGTKIDIPRDGWRTSGVALGPKGLVEWTVLDAQYVRVASHPRAVPQRRRRVFIVRDTGNWGGRPPLFLELESLRGDPTPRRHQGKRVAPTLEARASAGGAGWGTDFMTGGGQAAVAPTLSEVGGHARPGDNIQSSGYLIPATRIECGEIVPQAMSSKWSKGSSGPAGDEVANLVAFDTTQITSKANRSNPQPGDPCHPLTAEGDAPAIAMQAGATRENPASGPDGIGIREDGAAFTLEARAEVQAVAFSGRERGAEPAVGREERPPLAMIEKTGAIDTVKPWRVATATMAVRRLTPLECERLQGFPDFYTAITIRGKPAADGPRYRALGNSMACNVMAWIGERIAQAETL